MAEFSAAKVKKYNITENQIVIFATLAAVIHHCNG
jgi:hypothetical protein